MHTSIICYTNLDQQERCKKIANYIRNHQGCITEEACIGVKQHMSRSTFFKDLQKLIEDKEIRKEPLNKRDQRLFVDVDNPTVYVPEQLDVLEKKLKNLLESSKKEYSKIPPDDDYFDACYHPFHIAPFLLLHMIIDSYVIHSTITWPRKLKDKQSLTKTYTIIFSKIAAMQFLVSKSLMSLDQNKYNDYISNIVGLSTRNNLSHRECMSACLKLYEDSKMRQQVESIFDSLWEINYDILDLVYHVDYSRDGIPTLNSWRRLMEPNTYDIGNASDTYYRIINENKNLRINQKKITSY
jgi:hypothetical protein